ncbi:MAG: hypothetical protein JO235_11905 [Chroococcidiopsidaceae cyanobacterium CP_BM_RX_35]|nr:hypothetical protein [Chroococcidiopsidaceae cyanobacterium CP_BM_RX_35]
MYYWVVAIDEPNSTGKSASRCVSRESTPSAAIVDSQLVKPIQVVQAVGYDGAKVGFGA